MFFHLLNDPLLCFLCYVQLPLPWNPDDLVLVERERGRGRGREREREREGEEKSKVVKRRRGERGDLGKGRKFEKGSLLVATF